MVIHLNDFHRKQVSCPYPQLLSGCPIHWFRNVLKCSETRCPFFQFPSISRFCKKEWGDKNNIHTCYQLLAIFHEILGSPPISFTWGSQKQDRLILQDFHGDYSFHLFWDLNTGCTSILLHFYVMIRQRVWGLSYFWRTHAILLVIYTYNIGI